MRRYESTGVGGRRLDIRDMRPEKWRRAYVCWFVADELEIVSVPVRHWAVLVLERRGKPTEVWQPAFPYGGRWSVPEYWREQWPDRLLMVPNPGDPPPSAELLAGQVRALAKPPMQFRPTGHETTEAEVRALLAEEAEREARERAYPPPQPHPGEWWTPKNEAELASFDDLTDGAYDDGRCDSFRRFRTFPELFGKGFSPRTDGNEQNGRNASGDL